MPSLSKGAVRKSLVAGIALGLSLTGVVAPSVSAATSIFNSSPNVAIPDDGYNGTPASMALNTINASAIPAGHIVTDITVQIAINHTFVGDLTIKLLSPSGKILALAERPRGDGGHLTGDDGSEPFVATGDDSNLSASFPLMFNDAYSDDPENMGAGITDTQNVCQADGRCQVFPNPDQALVVGRSVANLAAFDGERPRGDWTLGVGDGFLGNIGTFVSWRLTITHQMSTSLSFDAALNLAIPDNAYTGTMASMATTTIDASAIPASHIVTHITVGIVVGHAWVGDVTVKLRSPTGTTLALIERPRGDNTANTLGDNGTDFPVGDSSNLSSTSALAFNDAYTNDPESMGLGIADAQSVCQHDGRCQFFPNPDQALVEGRSVANFAAFDGELASGNWTLGIGDSAAPDVGSLLRWSITIGHAPPLTACSTAPFPDVPDGHQFCAEIKWMSNAGVSTGFDDGTYRPSIAVTRQAMSAFMARLAGALPTPCAAPPFSDVPIDHPFCAEIQWMNSTGISTGFDDGTYRPSIAVTRQAMSAFMARLAKATLTACDTPPFPDVPVFHPFCPEIKWMNDAGISTGFNDGTYRPGIDVTRQAMSAFMQRVSSELP